MNAESRYAIYNLEVMACAESLIYFHQFLEGINFELFVNDKGFSHVLNQSRLSSP